MGSVNRPPYREGKATQYAISAPFFPRRFRIPERRTVFLVLLTVVTTGRSLAHMFLPDGGAAVIAGLDTAGVGGGNLIAILGQWGLEQLLLSLLAWVVVWRYRCLVPLVLLLQLLDWGGRIGVGLLKPVVAADPPPVAVILRQIQTLGR